MKQKCCEEQHASDDRHRPHRRRAPLWRDSAEMLGKRNRNQECDEEPAVVKSDRDAGDSTKLDLCFHDAESSTRP
jgi:hypothetical protein